MSAPLPDYAELHCLSAFSFQRGASIAEELFARAKGQDYRALAITDECSLAGIVRAWQAAQKHALPLITGNTRRLSCQRQSRASEQGRQERCNCWRTLRQQRWCR